MTEANPHPPETPDETEGKGRRILATPAWILAFLLLALSPWGWGGVLPEVEASLALGADLLLLLLALNLLHARRSRAPSLLSNPLFRLSGLCMGGFALFTVLQTVPLPRSVLSALSPAAADLHLADGGASLSLAPAATRASLVLLLSTAALFLTPPILLRRGRRLASILGVVTAVGGVTAAYALLNSLSNNELSLHYSKGTQSARACVPFVNPNHLATFLAVLLPAPLAVLLFFSPKGRAGEEETILLRVADFLSDLSKRYWKILAALAFAFAALGLTFSMSRAGILAGAGGLTAFFAALAALHRKGEGLPVVRMLIATLLVAILVGAALWLGLEPVLRRYAATEVGMEGRLHVWAISMEIFGDFPVFGTGLGTFTHVFPLHKPATLPVHYTFPHNEYLGILVECGLVGSLLLAGAATFGFAGLVRELARHRYRRTRQLGACWAIGGGTAFAIHAFFDFAVHIPAVAFLLSITLGAGFAAVRKPLSGRGRRRLKKQP
ncbi:MAG: O-antigen ligase family protein [Planctomycetota bacterium]|jgi:hypothetical protein